MNKDIASLLLRVTFGGTMLYGHGWKKFIKFKGDRPIKWADPLGLGPEISLGLASFAKVFCAGALIINLISRLASIPLIVTMLVAIFIVHINDPFSNSGKYSVDQMIKKRK